MYTATQSATAPSDRDIEYEDLLNSYDEFVKQSKELEEELETELSEMSEKLHNTTQKNTALSSQIKDLNSQLASLQNALSVANTKLKKESDMRRTAEQAQEDAENKAREAHTSLDILRDEYDRLNEKFVFQEDEMEVLKDEWGQEEERYQHELAELRQELNLSCQRETSTKYQNDDELELSSHPRKRKRVSMPFLNLQQKQMFVIGALKRAFKKNKHKMLCLST